jgi:DNA-binding XRE family transcriptional regulator
MQPTHYNKRVIVKLGSFGPHLGYPHTSAVRDADRLRELRPRAGRSAWRALYRQVGDMFVVAAVAPEAQSDPRGFGRSVRRAMQRLEKLEEDQMTKLSELRTATQIAAEDSLDPEIRREHERSALAHAVAMRVIGYRVDHGLTQTALARLLGMHQPAIARLEAGDHEPSLATLSKLARALGVEFHIDITPDAFGLRESA